MDNAIEKSTAPQYGKLVCNIGQLITSARDKVAVEVNTTKKWDTVPPFVLGTLL